MTVEPKQILKKRQSYIENEKKKVQELRKQWEDLEKQENVRSKMKELVVFIREKLE